MEESCSQRFARSLESAVEEFLKSEYELTATNAAIKAASGSKRFNLFGMFSSQAKEGAAAQGQKKHEPYEKLTKLNPYTATASVLANSSAAAQSSDSSEKVELKAALL